MHISLTAESCHSNSFVMMFVYCMSTKTPKIMKYGAGVDLVWIFGREMKGFTPLSIRHGLRDGNLSSSGDVDSLQAELPPNTKLERYPSRRPRPGSMPKPYPFWASPLKIYSVPIFQIGEGEAGCCRSGEAQGWQFE